MNRVKPLCYQTTEMTKACATCECLDECIFADILRAQAHALKREAGVR